MESNDKSVTDRVEKLEETISHLERFCDELNRVVYDQSKWIQKLEKRLDIIEDVQTQTDDLTPPPSDSPPPHYDIKK